MKATMKKNKKSPLLDKPLRNPGQSIDEEMNRIIDDATVVYIVAPILAIFLTLLEWWRWYTDMPYAPVVLTVMSFIVIIFSFFKLLKIRKKLANLKLGRDGEKAVGQYLELERENGYKVFHDLIGDGFNVDHVLIGERGIFSIETKTYSKPSKGKTEIVFSEEGLSIDGYPASNKIIIQAKAQENWLKTTITSLTGKDVTVQPIVVFPGWYIKNTKQHKTNDVWVLNPKALSTFINNRPIIYTEDEVKLIANQISRYIRSS